MKWFNPFWKRKAKLPEELDAASVAPEPNFFTRLAKDLSAAWRNDAGSSANMFTPRAVQVLALARKEADRLNHHFVGTEHLLLGLAKLGQGVAARILIKHGLDLEAARRVVVENFPEGPAPGLGNIPYTPRVKKVLALAIREAKALDHTYVGTEHLLLGLLSESEGPAARIFKQKDLNAAVLREEILKELRPAEAGTETPGGTSQDIEAVLPPTGPTSPSSTANSTRVVGERLPDPNVFTPRAQQVLGLARKEADRFNHNFVGTEHLLLGLIKLDQSVAVQVLLKLGLDPETIRMEVERQIGTGPDQKMIGYIRYTPRVKKALALAAKEAGALNRSYVGTELILLGILREGDGPAARILADFKLDPEQVRAEISKGYGSPP